jgi:hypothetical protein
VSYAAIELCIASQRVFIFVVYFVIDSVRKLLDTLSYVLDGVVLGYAQRQVKLFTFTTFLYEMMVGESILKHVGKKEDSPLFLSS